MILEVLADAGQVDRDRHADPVEFCLGADARKHQHLGRVDRTRSKDHAGRAGRFHLYVLDEVHTLAGRALHDQCRRLGPGQQRDIALFQHRVEIALRDIHPPARDGGAAGTGTDDDVGIAVSQVLRVVKLGDRGIAALLRHRAHRAQRGPGGKGQLHETAAADPATIERGFERVQDVTRCDRVGPLWNMCFPPEDAGFRRSDALSCVIALGFAGEVAKAKASLNPYAPKFCTEFRTGRPAGKPRPTHVKTPRGLPQGVRVPESRCPQSLNIQKKVSPELSSTPSLSVETQTVPSGKIASPSTLSTI